MNNLPLQPLVWSRTHSTRSALHIYFVRNDSESDGKYEVRYREIFGQPKPPATGFATIDEAKTWAWNHYNEKMQPYVKQDSITDIRNWFKAAKPKPTMTDITTQIGCHYEEVSEMDCSLYVSNRNHTAANLFKEAHSQPDFAENMISDLNHIELLDALCDQIVTATGVAYMMGFDIEGALKEVIRSNNSKMVDGKFEFDDNGKVTKPDSYSEPDLTKFVGVKDD